jgi:hypothetical protein
MPKPMQMSESVASKLAQAAEYRRLAATAHDAKAATQLLKWAAEIEAEVEQLRLKSAPNVLQEHR